MGYITLTSPDILSGPLTKAHVLHAKFKLLNMFLEVTTLVKWQNSAVARGGAGRPVLPQFVFLKIKNRPV